jgi:hypothetical protein
LLVWNVRGEQRREQSRGADQQQENRSSQSKSVLDQLAPDAIAASRALRLYLGGLCQPGRRRRSLVALLSRDRFGRQTAPSS